LLAQDPAEGAKSTFPLVSSRQHQTEGGTNHLQTPNRQSPKPSGKTAPCKKEGGQIDVEFQEREEVCRKRAKTQKKKKTSRPAVGGTPCQKAVKKKKKTKGSWMLKPAIRRNARRQNPGSSQKEGLFPDPQQKNSLKKRAN